MVNKLILVSVLIVMMLLVSGCTDEQNPDSGQEVTVTGNNNTDLAGMSAEDLATIDGLSDSYEYLGAPSLTVEKVQREYVNSSGIVAAAEGLYLMNDTNLYIDVIEMESSELAEEFVSEYVSSFKELSSGTRFKEETFNGHSVTRITTYATAGGEDVPRYTYIWSNENFVFVIGGSTEDDSTLSAFAEATGY